MVERITTSGPKLQRLSIGLESELLEGLDTWRLRQPDLPSRAEAVRRLLRPKLEAMRDTRAAAEQIEPDNMQGMLPLRPKR